MSVKPAIVSAKPFVEENTQADNFLAVVEEVDTAEKEKAEAEVREPMPEPAGPEPVKRTRALTDWFTAMWPRLSIRAASVLVALALWQLASTMQWNYLISFENVPTPLAVGTEFWVQLNGETFFIHVLVSIKRILIGYLLAAVLGILTGVLMGRYRVAEDIFSPYIEILRPIPAVAWIPLAILMLPTEESSIIFITFLGAFFPIVLNTIHGVEQTPPVLIRAAKCFGADDKAMLWHVIIPGAMPSIVAGLAIGMGVSWFSLLAGEIISGQYGIGYFTWAAYTMVEYSHIIIGMLVIGGLGTLSTALVKIVTAPLLTWQGDKGAQA